MTSLIHSNPGGTITNKDLSSFKEFAKNSLGQPGSHAFFFCIIKTGRNWDTFIQPNLSGEKKWRKIISRNFPEMWGNSDHLFMAKYYKRFSLPQKKVRN